MPRGREQVSAETWRDRVRRWKESGLSSREFAKQEGIGRPQALSYWVTVREARVAPTSRLAILSQHEA
jgi:hypothetical protein